MQDCLQFLELYQILRSFLFTIDFCGSMYNTLVINWNMILAYYVSGLPMDLIHAAATVIFILIAAEPMLEKLDRIKVKYGLVE